jgi:uncharacterized membrane protein YfcA
VLPIELIAFLVALAAGGFGALIGVGGGLILVPVLAGLLGVEIHVAIGVSLLGIVATSGGGSAAYLRSGLVDRRLGLLLLLATAIGGLVGAYLAGLLAAQVLSAAFGVLLALVAARMVTAADPVGGSDAGADEGPARRGLAGSYVEPTTGEQLSYRAERLRLAAVVSTIGGGVSGLLGVGGGVINVPTMNVLMGVPIRVAAATSTYMLGATAAVGALLYLARGQVDMLLAAPIVLGTFIGARAGAWLAHRTEQRRLRFVFAAVAAIFALQMLARAAGLS